ncbi:MAG: TPM domain-containing protein, partial [Gemmatimonadetes bacterium]|nr:TPM domain-containing protein [Gemmatimonadota bacterium]
MRSLLLLLALQLQIPAPVGYVNDFAGIIAEPTRQAMLAVIDEVRQKSGGEIVVVTLSDLGGRASIDVARDIGRQWKVGAIGGPGDAAKNAGVVLLLKPGVLPGDGKAEIAIATGSGAEGFVTDAAAGRIRDAIGEEAINAGRYDAGLLVGVQLLAQAYAREFQFELSGAARPPESVAPPRPAFPLGLIPLLIFLFFFIAILGRRSGRAPGLLSSLLWVLFWSGAGRRRGGWGGGGGRGGG